MGQGHHLLIWTISESMVDLCPARESTLGSACFRRPNARHVSAASEYNATRSHPRRPDHRGMAANISIAIATLLPLGRSHVPPPCKARATNRSRDLNAGPPPHCHCGRAPVVSEHAPVSQRWGLPSASCPASHYLLHQYPKLHAQWSEEGRVLAFCWIPTGWGNYLLGVSTAVLMGILLDRAVILNCGDDPANPLADHSPLTNLFMGPHFNWTATQKLNLTDWALPGRSAGGNPAHSTKLYKDTNRPSGHLLATGRAGMPSAVRLAGLGFNDMPAWNMLLRFPALVPLAERKLGSALLQTPHLDGCLLRYVLAPMMRLTSAARRATPSTPRTADGLLHAVALHVRMGDSTFAPNATWPWQHDTRSHLLRRDPHGAFECLMRASATDPRETQSHVAGALTRALRSECRACILVSDSSWAELCAKTLLEQPILTPGSAWHPNASPKLPGHTSQMKMYLDWWLLATSDRVLGTHKSSFSESAIRFRGASAPLPSYFDRPDVCRLHLHDGDRWQAAKAFKMVAREFDLLKQREAPAYHGDGLMQRLYRHTHGWLSS